MKEDLVRKVLSLARIQNPFSPARKNTKPARIGLFSQGRCKGSFLIRKPGKHTYFSEGRGHHSAPTLHVARAFSALHQPIPSGTSSFLQLAFDGATYSS